MIIFKVGEVVKVDRQGCDCTLTEGVIFNDVHEGDRRVIVDTKYGLQEMSICDISKLV